MVDPTSVINYSGWPLDMVTYLMNGGPDAAHHMWHLYKSHVKLELGFFYTVHQKTRIQLPWSEIAVIYREDNYLRAYTKNKQAFYLDEKEWSVDKIEKLWTQKGMLFTQVRRGVLVNSLAPGRIVRVAGGPKFELHIAGHVFKISRRQLSATLKKWPETLTVNDGTLTALDKKDERVHQGPQGHPRRSDGRNGGSVSFVQHGRRASFNGV